MNLPMTVTKARPLRMPPSPAFNTETSGARSFLLCRALKTAMPRSFTGYRIPITSHR